LLDLLAATVTDLAPDIVDVTESCANDSILDCELQLHGYTNYFAAIGRLITEVVGFCCMSEALWPLSSFIQSRSTVNTFGARL